MDIGSKVFSSLICKRLFKRTKKQGVKYQFGSSPGVGCQDGTFTIKNTSYAAQPQLTVLCGICRPSKGV